MKSSDSPVKNFSKAKRKTIELLSLLIEEGKVDHDIIDILNKINGLAPYYTLSSCSGRVQIIEVEEIGKKVGSRVLGKWHSFPKMEDVESTMARHRKGTMMMMVQSPILHVAASGLEKALALRNAGVNAGLKYSSIKSIKEGKVVTELLTAYRADMPLGKEGTLYIEGKALEFACGTGGRVLAKGKGRLRALERELSRLEV